MAVVSDRMARTHGVYISLERPGVPGAGRSSGSAGGGSWLAHRSRILLLLARVHSARPPPYALRPSADGPEQSRHSVHATECRDCSGAGVHDLQAHGGGLQLRTAQTCSVIVDSKDTVGRRRRHQADMRRRRRQGQRSPLWPQRAAAWSPVPRSGTLECATLASVQTFSTISNAYVHMTHATSLARNSSREHHP